MFGHKSKCDSQNSTVLTANFVTVQYVQYSMYVVCSMLHGIYILCAVKDSIRFDSFFCLRVRLRPCRSFFLSFTTTTTTPIRCHIYTTTRNKHYIYKRVFSAATPTSTTPEKHAEKNKREILIYLFFVCVCICVCICFIIYEQKQQLQH